MSVSITLLRESAVDLRRIAGEARLRLVDRPTPADVEALRCLRCLRVQFVAGLAGFQQRVHFVLDEAAEGPGCCGDAVHLKIGAIALGRAYDDFAGRWMERSFIANWAEYRLSALRIINIVLAAIAPIERDVVKETSLVSRQERKMEMVL